MNFAWEHIPKQVRSRLLQGGVGKAHVFETAHAVFQSISGAEPDLRGMLFDLGRDMLLSVWEGAYLDPLAAVTLSRLQTEQSFLPTQLAGCVKLCALQPEPSESLVRQFDPALADGIEAYERHLARTLHRGEHLFFVLHQAMTHAMREHRVQWLEGVLRREAALPAPLREGLLADVAFAQGNWQGAAAGYALAGAGLPLWTWEQRRAEALFRDGAHDAAVQIWRALIARRPWQINLLLRLSDVLRGRTGAGVFPSGRGAVLLYTWNKQAEIDATLRSLAATELEAPGADVVIFVLDNGSTDATPEVLRMWEAHFGGRMRRITLPVNVGAPAARNWLLSLPEVRAADWAAFLDDDVDVPHDWLRGLWAALTAYPDAGVASGHAVDYHAPMSQQWTDMHIVPLEGADDGRVFRDRFTFTSLHEQAWDFGDFTFMRPCVTAIGCCHMFTRQAMDEGGTFDVRFSPSQSDDVDHDMRRGLEGHLPVYNGHVRVLHKRSTGYHKTPNRRGWASAVGNWYKLQASYSVEDIAKLYERDQQTMWEDLHIRLMESL